jgi:hypothetical protein
VAHEQLRQLARLRIDAPDPLAQRLGLGSGRLVGQGSGGGGGGSATGSSTGGACAAAATGSMSATRKSSWRAPHDGQKRERALMRSPQLAQYLVSVPAMLALPRWYVHRNGYHFETMDGGGATRRLQRSLRS